MTTADISTSPRAKRPGFRRTSDFPRPADGDGRARSRPLGAGDGRGPAPLTPAAAGVALAMFDLATPVWLAPPIDNPAVRGFLAFHCRCPIANDPAAAAFAIVDGDSAGDLAKFAPGTPEYPDRSTTVIIQVDGIAEAPGARLRGPGIKNHHDLRVTGVDDRFWAAQAANAKRFPLGVDVVLAHGHRLVALPRTTKVET